MNMPINFLILGVVLVTRMMARKRWDTGRMYWSIVENYPTYHCLMPDIHVKHIILQPGGKHAYFTSRGCVPIKTKKENYTIVLQLQKKVKLYIHRLVFIIMPHGWDR